MTTKTNISPDPFEALKKKWHHSNIMQMPRITKIVLSAGIGSIKDKKKIELVSDRLTRIAGQKVVTKGAKKSIASFKVRQGDPVGYEVTLRGKRMHGFLLKLLNVTLPRTRDFRGLQESSVDEMGNLTIGIREHTIFPETVDEDLKDVFGLAVTLVSSARNREEALDYFKAIGFPFGKSYKVEK
ncbi:MAG TPA: 50S ribosomal protein L5 [Candidatus Paceibacterota bacterium]